MPYSTTQNTEKAADGKTAVSLVKEKRPDLIIGVACERDLTSGIQDTYPIPVFGILNRRPNGPCYDTDVSLELVERGMTFFLKHDGEKTKRPGVDGPGQAV